MKHTTKIRICGKPHPLLCAPVICILFASTVSRKQMCCEYSAQKRATVRRPLQKSTTDANDSEKQVFLGWW